MPLSLFGLSSAGTLMLMLLGLVMAYIAVRAAAYLLKALVVGMLFMAMPFVMLMAGMQVAIGLRSLAWFMGMGIASFFTYSSARFGFRAVRAVISPLKGNFRKREPDVRRPSFGRRG